MRRPKAFWMCLLATMFPASLSLLSQSSVPLTITGLGSREVHLALYDPTAHQAFVEFFADRDWAKLQSLAVVLTNSSPRAIIGLTVRWTVTEQSGDVRQAKEHGEDVPELLSRLAAAQSDQSDFTGIWSARIVGLFRGVQDVEPLLAKLAGLPKPNFHRDR